MTEPTYVCERCGEEWKIAHNCPVRVMPPKGSLGDVSYDPAVLEDAKRLLLKFAESDSDPQRALSANAAMLEEFKARGPSGMLTLKRAACELAADPKLEDEIRNKMKMFALVLMVLPQ